MARVSTFAKAFAGRWRIVEMDNWDNDATIAAISEAVSAFALPRSSRDAAVVLTLEPGAYTVQLSGVNNTSGAGLIEIYALDNL